MRWWYRRASVLYEHVENLSLMLECTAQVVDPEYGPLLSVQLSYLQMTLIEPERHLKLK